MGKSNTLDVVKALRKKGYAANNGTFAKFSLKIVNEMFLQGYWTIETIAEVYGKYIARINKGLEAGINNAETMRIKEG